MNKKKEEKNKNLDTETESNFEVNYKDFETWLKT